MKCKDCGNTHPALPGFPNHVLCDYYRLHMSNLADASRCEHFKAKVLTNADRIRAMTDEELAEFISGKARTFGEEYEGYLSALDWLRQEADKGGVDDER